MDVLTAARVAITLFAVLAALFLFVQVWPHRDDSTARPLLVAALVAALGGLVHLFVGQTASQEFLVALLGRPVPETLWVLTGATTTVGATGACVVFAMRYTGRSATLLTGITVGVSVLTLITAGLTALAVVSGPTLPIFRGVSLLYLLMGLLVTVGAFLLVWTSLGRNPFPYREPALLSTGALGLLSGVFVAQLFERPVLFPTFLALGVLLIAVPVSRYPTFETIPAARAAGRDRVIEEMEEGVLVVEDGGRLYDANPAAASLLAFDRDDGLDEPIEQVIGRPIDPETVVDAPEPIGFETDAGRSVEIVGNRITDHRGRSFGAVLLCEDVTERRVEENRLHLLSRFLVDVVSDRMERIQREAAAGSQDGDQTMGGETVGEQIWTETTVLTEVVSRTRDFEASLGSRAAIEREATDVRGVVRAAITAIGSDGGAGITFDDETTPHGSGHEDTTVAIPGETLQAILEDVFETTIEWSTGGVDVTVADGSPIEIRIRTSPVGSFDALDHRSDLPLLLTVSRLWIEEWGGSLTVTAPETDGRRVCVTLPDTGTSDRSRRDPERSRQTRARRNRDRLDAPGEDTSIGREGGE